MERTEQGSDKFIILLHMLGLAIRADDGSFNGVAADELDNFAEMTMHWSAKVEAAPLRPPLLDLPLPEVREFLPVIASFSSSWMVD